MRVDDLPLATDVELETLPPGLYVACDCTMVPIERETHKVYDFPRDRYDEGPAVLLARVVAKGMGQIPNPEAVESVEIRGDGGMVIKQWVLTDGADAH